MHIQALANICGFKFQLFVISYILIFTVRANGACGMVSRHAQYSTSSDKVTKVYPPNVPGYKYVNGEDPNMSMKEMSDRAAQTLFWTELARGFAVTLGHIFKVLIIRYLENKSL